MTSLRRNKGILALLAFMFALPGIAAYLIYTHTDWLRSNTTNQGVFVQSSFQLPQSEGIERKWHIVLWSPQTCGHDCKELLNRMAKVRLALGRRFFDVELDILLGPDADDKMADLDGYLTGKQDKVIKLTNDEWQKRPGLVSDTGAFIVNPDGFFLLYYANLKEPHAMFRDLKHLLSVRT